MLKHHIIIAFRNMLRNKFYSILNILGLAMGLAAFIIIGLYLFDEWSYDAFHKDSERMFRVTQTNIWDDDQEQLDALGPAVAQSLLAGIPEVEIVTRIHRQGNFLVSMEDIEKNKIKAFDESKVFAVDSNFFQMFDFQLLEGEPTQVLSQPNTIVLSEESAQKYFGNQSALGKVLKVSQGNEEKSFVVTGVFKSILINIFKVFQLALSDLQSESSLLRICNSLLRHKIFVVSDYKSLNNLLLDDIYYTNIDNYKALIFKHL